MFEAFAAPGEFAPSELPPALQAANVPLQRPVLAPGPQPGAVVILVEVEARGA